MLIRAPTRWARPKLVRFILPCQPVLAAKVPEGDGWLHELKHDGFRVVVHKEGERVHLWSRNGRDRLGDLVAIADTGRAAPWPSRRRQLSPAQRECSMRRRWRALST